MSVSIGRQTLFFFKDVSWLITLLNGSVNSLTLLMFGQTVTHHTGNITKLAQAISARDAEMFLSLFAMLLCFFLGATLSGLIQTKDEHLRLRRCGYTLCLLGVGMAFVSLLMMKREEVVYLFAFLAGVQNGMGMLQGGILLRFTHMTGYMTDAAFALAGILRKEKKALERFVPLMLHLFAFMFGAILGAELYEDAVPNAFLWVGLAYSVVGALALWQATPSEAE